MATKFFEEGLCTRTILLIPKKMKILFVFFLVILISVHFIKYKLNLSNYLFIKVYILDCISKLSFTNKNKGENL